MKPLERKKKQETQFFLMALTDFSRQKWTIAAVELGA
jgi:hypothetical protein